VSLDSGDVVEAFDDEPEGLVVDMVKEDGTWKVSDYTRDEGVCET
jgi:hypothetical protein